MKIRMRERMCASPPAGLSKTWVEYQVVDGRKILARCGTHTAAERWIADNSPTIQRLCDYSCKLGD